MNKIGGSWPYLCIPMEERDKLQKITKKQINVKNAMQKIQNERGNEQRWKVQERNTRKDLSTETIPEQS